MGILAIAALAGAIALGFAFAGGSSYPTVAVTIVALCKALQARGETAPLPPSSVANTDLALRAIKVLGLPGSWPPSSSDSTAKRKWWAAVIQLAARVRSGEIRCIPIDGDDESGGDESGGDESGGDESGGDESGGVPSLAAIQREICTILMPLADPEDHYLEQGSMPAAAAADVAAAAIESLGAEPAAIPPPLLDQATQYALDVIEGVTTCGIDDRIIAPSENPSPGSWYQIRKGDNLLDLVGQAYAVASGSRRLELAREVNGHPYNAGLQRPAANTWNAENIGPTIVSFFRSWRPNPKTVLQRFEPGNAYAVVFLPEL